jgi:putative SOS response-associated peptidase YedK
MALHDRMPVVLAPEHFAAWLDVTGTSPEEAAALLKPAPDDLFEAIEMHLRSTTLSATSQASWNRCNPRCFRGRQ